MRIKLNIYVFITPSSGTLKVKLLGKTIDLKVVGNKQFKGHTPYDQNRLMSEGERHHF
jgi:hypothetical protein